jgi:hypothetical protein
MITEAELLERGLSFLHFGKNNTVFLQKRKKIICYKLNFTGKPA